VETGHHRKQIIQEAILITCPLLIQVAIHDEVLKDIGNPDKVIHTNYSAEVIACYIRLVWIKKQLVLASKRFPGAKGCDYSQAAASSGLVDASLEIAEVDFLPHEEINQIIYEDINQPIKDYVIVGNYWGINPNK
jgi:hypothetical protein